MKSACTINANMNECDPGSIKELISKVDALAQEVSGMATVLKDMKEIFEKDITHISH